MSAGYFSLLGLRPQLGRVFEEQEDRTPGSHPVAVISDGLWRRCFGSQADVDRQDRVPEQDLPDRRGRAAGVVQRTTGFGRCLGADHHGADPSGQPGAAHQTVHHVAPGPGASESGDQPGGGPERRLRSLEKQIETVYPLSDQTSAWGIRLASLQKANTDPAIRRSLLVLLAAVGFVLLITCVNVAGLLLARGISRRGEIATRMALGATRDQIVRQLLVESLVLSVGAGVLALLFAREGIELMDAFRPADSQGFHHSIRPAAGLRRDRARHAGAALQFRPRRGLRGPLRSRSGSADHAIDRWRRRREGRRNRRRQAQGGPAPGAQPPGSGTNGPGDRAAGRGGSDAAKLRLPDDDPDRLRACRSSDPAGDRAPQGLSGEAWTLRRAADGAADGIDPRRPIGLCSRCDASVGFVRSQSPASSSSRDRRTEQTKISIGVHRAGPGYIRALRVPLLAGRWFTEQDADGAKRVVVINETMARRYWPGTDPVGQNLDLGMAMGPGYAPVEIVGVVSDVKYDDMAAKFGNDIYVPYLQSGYPCYYLTVRTAGDPLSLVAAVRQAVTAVNRESARLRCDDDGAAYRQLDLAYEVRCRAARAVRRAGAGAGRHGPVRIDRVLDRAADPRDRDSHGAGRPVVPGAPSDAVSRHAAGGRGRPSRSWRQPSL